MKLVNIYTCWISILVKSYEDAIVAGLIKKGYTVGPASSDGNLTLGNDNQPSYLMAFTIHKTVGEVTAKDIYADITSIITEIGARIYNIIIAQAYDANWIGCNFTIPMKKAATPPPLPPPNKSNLN